MASVAIPIEEVRLRPQEPKSSRSPKTKSSSFKHKTRSPAEAVRKSEQSLNQLLEDFEEGRLNAFGSSDMLQKMQEIREMQEKLTLKHFEIDQMRISQESQAGAGEEKVDSSLHELTQALDKLGSAIQSLHSNSEGRVPEETDRKQRRVQISSEQPQTQQEHGRTTPL